ncbi:MarR family winged helix-turn-helix transcriptional regulator [Streptomyces minutiscleroticus]|uniref:MarR family winged helix-turn-helix transcriptional regulator n=1 Tax=Streptomyces minutiscleroticus TaxID=68238 RepID=UPI00167ED236|nr:MarR family transcriptional regulator [Streptomyces minutiscleroticus]
MAHGDQLGGSGDDAQAIALEIADAVDALTDLWSLAAQGAALRLSAHQLRALRILQASPGLNLTAMADGLRAGLPTASRLCDRLEAAGLLERAVHPRNRREVRLSLTAQGRLVMEDLAARRMRVLTAALEGMRPAERVALRRGLRAFRTTQNTDGSLPPEGA